METCDTCGFDPADYSDRDLATAPRWLGAMCDQTVEGTPGDILVGPLVADVLDPLRSTIGTIAPAEGAEPDVDAIHSSVHLLRDLGRRLHQAGAGAPSQAGTVAQINTSDGGVPKAAVPSADVGRRGLLGDRQGDRKHHGRPFQALCLWSADVIDALRAEGHPIHAGAAGENITISGIDWTSLRPGVRLLIGDVSCELSAWAVPCRKNDQWFTDRSDRIDHDQHPGWSRVYAWVLEPGTVRTGDPVLVEA